MARFIAHIKDSISQVQSLESHLDNVAQLAAKFCKDFDSSDFGYLAGILHDVGKYSKDFQQYIRDVSAGGEAAKKWHRGMVDHSSAGAIFCFGDKYLLPLSYVIAGHHGGLLNSDRQTARIAKSDCLECVKQYIPNLSKKLAGISMPKNLDVQNINIWIRMIFSSLVDADFLDTESFMSPETKRIKGDSMAVLLARYNKAMRRLSDENTSEIDYLRTQINSTCANAADVEGNFFSLAVPTGGGKTLASMAWALNRAVKRNFKRIIVAIPYTSIITQTAKAYREIFGEENVLEHHGDADFFNDDDSGDSCGAEADNMRGRLWRATENWDAPIVVTTNVQLFESLYSASVSRCRKLHNLASSIIILDEAQMLPPQFLKPILWSLDALADFAKCNVLFCTATQPVFAGEIGSGASRFASPLKKINEIPLDYALLQKVFKRTKIEFMEGIQNAESMKRELSSNKSFLCIVNTRRRAAEMFKNFENDETAFHLSRSMCSAHLDEVLKKIRTVLADGKCIKVISTQLIECGVDVDFPLVYREFAGLDSIIQAAGRCNRNGRQSGLGRVKVFKYDAKAPLGFIGKGCSALSELLLSNAEEVDTPENIRKYFEIFYGLVNDFDKARIEALLCSGVTKGAFEFEDAAAEFRLIDDGDTRSVVVAYEEKGKELVKRLEQNGVNARLMRELRRYSVGVRMSEFNELRNLRAICEIDGVFVLSEKSLYNQKYGLVINDKFSEEILIK